MILMKFDPEIKGSSKVKGYEDWVEFETYAISSSRNIQVQGDDRDISNPYVSELMLTKGADKTSPEFFIQAKIGKAFKKATIAVVQAAGANDKPQNLLTFEVAEPIVSSFSTQCSSGNRPSEHISLNFSKIKYDYTNFDGGTSKGSVSKEYNLITNTASAA
ncbi:hypothetical protein GCM10009504_05470 [Pseudomonas laurentiana]|uniref:Type VI secretion system tube protein Hcp n=1 Tax=Pseudomonas laurentiana TaxID=2364649 RepID=A0A6I5RM07_9PSED|nr:type VI secretion system tube protein Hcp [Pseudomonas laurentiana]NES09132.1 type VI secretion system tube protein Hcp [Pseudomonas laurentiana]GGU51682.1 hypothetical protein GCM10009504_05470 [Pseudomonas laurentiana]